MNWTRGHTIGRGSTAAVSIATSDSGEVFAVKSAELAHSELLQREQHFLCNLSSPYLISYKGCDITRENNKHMYNIFMEYMPGGTVADASHRLNEAMIVYYTRQIVQGLEYLHSNGIVHCDIKGRNILIGQSGAKIADLGIAKKVAPPCKAVAIGGTPMFMAPEVARGEEQGYPADIWALGCTVIEMATGGELPWPNHGDPISILYKIGFSGELPEFPNFLSAQAEDFLGKCLRRDPKERWTAKQLINHPFLNELDSYTKRIKEGFDSISPTSILDQGIWNSVQETESLFLDRTPLSSPEQRIRRLGLNSGEPNWRAEESWVMVRASEFSGASAGDGEGRCGPVTGWVAELESRVSGEVELINLKDKNVSSSCSCCYSSSNNASVDSTCEDCCDVLMRSRLNFERPKKVLVINDQFKVL